MSVPRFVTASGLVLTAWLTASFLHDSALPQPQLGSEGRLPGAPAVSGISHDEMPEETPASASLPADLPEIVPVSVSR